MAGLVGHVDMGRVEPQRLDDGLERRLRIRQHWRHEHQVGQHHKMQLVDVNPGRSFALLTAVVPGTRFRFNCRAEPAGTKTKVSQTVEVGGALGPVMGGMLGPQVSKDFDVLLQNLARKAESA